MPSKTKQTLGDTLVRISESLSDLSHVLSFQGVGEPPVFFGATLFFAIKAAIAEARRERGLGEPFPLSSPATAEKIRMACQDQFTEMVQLTTGC